MRCHEINSSNLFHSRFKISFQSVFTTVQPDGQLLVPRVIVESVPRADVQVKVPDVATPESQLVAALDGFQAVNATSTEDKEVQPLNMLE